MTLSPSLRCSSTPALTMTDRCRETFDLSEPTYAAISQTHCSPSLRKSTIAIRRGWAMAFAISACFSNNRCFCLVIIRQPQLSYYVIIYSHNNALFDTTQVFSCRFLRPAPPTKGGQGRRIEGRSPWFGFKCAAGKSRTIHNPCTWGEAGPCNRPRYRPGSMQSRISRGRSAQSGQNLL